MSFPYKPLFIVGYPRSGTTWTMWLLTQHPEVVVSLHGGFFHSLAPLYNWTNSPGSFGKFIIPSSNVETTQSGNDNNLYIDWPTAFSREHFNQIVHHLTCEYFNTIAQYGDNPKVVVENTPENLEFLPWIIDAVPEAFVLYIIRDPRSVWLSVYRSLQSWMEPHTKGSFPRTLVQNMILWRKYMDLSWEIQKSTGNYAEIKFEDLKTNGPNELQRIFNWLDLPNDKKLCEQAFANTTIQKLKQKMPSPTGFFNKGLKDGWKKKLSNSEIRQIEYLVGSWMDELNYERQLPVQAHKPWQLWVSEQKTKTFLVAKRQIKKFIER